MVGERRKGERYREGEYVREAGMIQRVKGGKGGTI
jgi:hypothetical protein